MKRLLLAIGITLLLVACGGETTSQEEQPVPEGDDMAQPEETEPVTTDDPLEFADKTTEDMVFVDGANEYIIENYYVNDETDERGFNTYEEDGFTFRYALVETANLADAEQGEEPEREIQIFGEVINDTDVDHYFIDRLLIKTDDNEATSVQFGLNGAGAANEKNKFNDKFPLEYEIPESFTFTILDPTFDESDEANWNEDGSTKEPDVVYESEFHKE